MPAKKTRELPDLHPPQPGSAACYPDRNNIKAMKKLISKTSVNLGNDSLDYITEQVDKESLIRGSPVKGPNVAMQKDRVRKLQQASWTTGSPNDHTYTTSNTLLDPTGNMGDYTAQMSLAAKKILRNSHLHLGNDATDYSSSAQSGMVEWTPEVKKDSMEGKKMVKQMKAVISATNCVLGDDKVAYESDATAAFRYDASKVVMASINEETKNDLRSSHLSLGNDRIVYDQHATTNFMPFDEKAAMASKPDQSVIAKQVKASHLCFGDADVDYSSSTQRQMDVVPKCGY